MGIVPWILLGRSAGMIAKAFIPGAPVVALRELRRRFARRCFGELDGRADPAEVTKLDR